MTPNEVVEKTQNAIEASNRVLIKELISDLENKGIKPVIAVDGEVKNLRLINESQLEDFYAKINASSFDCGDFSVLEVDGINDCNLAVIVVYKKSGKAKEYKYSHDLHWVAQFTIDLKNNFFTD